ncbi:MULTISPECIES: class I SAM-dependent methyltransferase [Spirulina sp. CCY15215]|uniref:class I SAM-dependent methyltransferase n=1 Tax=Spirulina sp. CCY15215 TaxID=2767591 RepID=UPI00194EF510|nr:class I SAM-dependent methyltransferase [Spirulina major]
MKLKVVLADEGKFLSEDNSIESIWYVRCDFDVVLNRETYLEQLKSLDIQEVILYDNNEDNYHTDDSKEDNFSSPDELETGTSWLTNLRSLLFPNKIPNKDISNKDIPLSKQQSPPERWFIHTLCALSLFYRSAQYFKTSLPYEEGKKPSNEEMEDITAWVKQLSIDFFNTKIEQRVLSLEDGNAHKRQINERYMNILKNNGFLVKEKEKPQAEVRELFGRVGLGEDLMMRVPALSGNEDWVYSINRQGEMVETRDWKLAFAQYLAQMEGDPSYLEVGSGSGFVSLYLKGLGKDVRGMELSDYRVASAKILAEAKGIEIEFIQGSLEKLPYPDNSMDIVFSCFVLEQCQEILEQAIAECVRVAKDYCVFLEPSVEHYVTLPSIVHISEQGQPMAFEPILSKTGYPFRVERPTFSHYYNSAAIYIVEKG